MEASSTALVEAGSGAFSTPGLCLLEHGPRRASTGVLVCRVPGAWSTLRSGEALRAQVHYRGVGMASGRQGPEGTPAGQHRGAYDEGGAEQLKAGCDV